MQVDRTSDSSWEDEQSGGLPVAVGDVLDGKYRLVRVLGKGGMGVIMAAVHEELGHRVALKFLLKSASQNDEVVARFNREARAAAMIKSEHATRVLDIGKLPNGSPYMVLEFLEGTDLGQVIARKGPLPTEDAVTYVLEACEAIAEAHSLGIVHRDLKPDNLFLARRPDGTRSVKVLDFGISKLPIENGLSTERGAPLTTTSAVIGSPMYMSPEQLRATRDVDTRSDIWSLGVTLYELIAGQGPFPWKSLPELCASILKESPTPIRSVKPNVPVELEAVLIRCLQKDPADRFEDVAELAAALSLFAKPSGIASSQRAMRLLCRYPFDEHTRATQKGDSAAIAITNEARFGATTQEDPRVKKTRSPSSPPVTSTSTLESRTPDSATAARKRSWFILVVTSLLIIATGAGYRLRRSAEESATEKARSGIESTVAAARLLAIALAVKIEAAKAAEPPPPTNTEKKADPRASKSENGAGKTNPRKFGGPRPPPPVTTAGKNPYADRE